MSDTDTPRRVDLACPECETLVPGQSAAPNMATPGGLPRRAFLSVLGATTARVAVGGVGVGAALASAQPLWADEMPRVPAEAKPKAGLPEAKSADAKPPRPAEDLVRELYASLTAEQKSQVVHDWDAGANAPVKPGDKPKPGAIAARLRVHNAPAGCKIGDVYTPAQQALIETTLKALSNGERGFEQMTRKGTYDASGSLDACGVDIYGDPAAANGQGRFAWVFSGHHLTVRCDSNLADGIGWGGPIYYGHTPHGYSTRNVFYFQTQTVMALRDALSADQAAKAVITTSPGEGLPSVRARPAGQPRPGLSLAELSADQKAFVEKVLGDLLAPFRREDADEILGVVKSGGGLDSLSLAFYRSEKNTDPKQWNFWRVEGPGLIWNYRALPHVHCFVNIHGLTATGV